MSQPVVEILPTRLRCPATLAPGRRIDTDRRAVTFCVSTSRLKITASFNICHKQLTIFCSLPIRK